MLLKYKKFALPSSTQSIWMYKVVSRKSTKMNLDFIFLSLKLKRTLFAT
jgi:hypothetical protein